VFFVELSISCNAYNQQRIAKYMPRLDKLGAFNMLNYLFSSPGVDNRTKPAVCDSKPYGNDYTAPGQKYEQQSL